MDKLTEAALELLDRLEAEEAKLLSWGVVDGSFTEEELLEHADIVESHLRPADHSASEMVGRLLEMVLLWELPGPFAEPRYRTRSAEAVRLAARLKQLFTPSQWEIGPDLVADFRYHISPRRFPRRDISVEEFIARLKVCVDLTSAQQAVARSSFETGGPEFRLSEFQYEACESALQGLKNGGSGATVVSAGTGSGKTIAFLLPALLQLASGPRPSTTAAVLAVYPRNELLKDQMRAAVSFLEPTREAMRASRGKPVSIGAYFGGVPRDAADAQSGRYNKWRTATTTKGTAALECPFLECPTCGSHMVWPVDDLKAGTERLECDNEACDTKVGPDEIRLTRESLLRSPPDILFTSTEMLNRALPDKSFGSLFGVGVSESPSIVVLDEIHTYEGVHGAQVGLLLRRWRHLSGARPHFIGLSATIVDGARFMEELTGIYEVKIRVVEPDAAHMSSQGAEYTLALRGNSSAKTSLLSTTIQAAMLFSRVLDPTRVPMPQRVSKGVFGGRIFLFTDNLDVTNRLFDNLNDAEGWWGGGKPNRNAGGSLANIRGDQHPGSQRRWNAGQGWQLSQSIGHSLQTGTRIPRTVGRTSSQDQGVESNASMIVATASLEVGFDDPDVGVVIQHKAPGSAASYLQRKGRAGRTQMMRPWTLVILSDFGRDRLLYERYEDLFEPRLSARHLPIRNPYVLRIQATFALIDWLRTRVPAARGGELRYALSAPVMKSQLTDQIGLVLSQLLTDSAVRAELRNFLQASLELKDEYLLDSVLWGAPRSLLLEVVPTLLRRLETGWENEYFRKHDPLPEFLPRALFEDLNLPELELVLPGNDEPERMGLRQGISEFAPGRVSRRFATWKAASAHWVLPSSGDADAVDLEAVFQEGAYTTIGELRTTSGDSVTVVRPSRIVLQVVPRDVLPSSNAFLVWESRFIPRAEGKNLSLPCGIRERLGAVRVSSFCHSMGDSVEVCRFAPAVRISTQSRGGQSHDRQLPFTIGNTAAALGFLIDVDGIRISFALPGPLHARVSDYPDLARTVRVERFRHSILHDEFLGSVGNQFTLSWIFDAALAAVARASAARRESTEAVIQGGALTADGLTEALRTVFGVAMLDEESETLSDPPPDDEDNEDAPALSNKKLQELTDVLQIPEVVDRIQTAAAHLFTEIDQSWDSWLAMRTAESLSAGVLQACERMAPDSAGDSLLADIVWTTPGDCAAFELWITETSPGGAGAIQRLTRLIQEDDQAFYALIEASFGPSDRELAIATFEELLGRITPGTTTYHDDIAVAVEAVRLADGMVEKTEAMEELVGTLRRVGFLLHPVVITAINLRLLKPGSSQTSDELQHRLTTKWNDLEEVVGYSLPARVFAEIESHSVEHDQHLAYILGAAGQILPTERFKHILSLLGPSGPTLRAEALEAHNPYRVRGYRDRLLVTSLFGPSISRIYLSSPTWWDEVNEALKRNGSAEIVSPSDQNASLRSAILRLLESPIDSGIIKVHARIRGYSRDGGEDVVTLELPEMFT